MDGACEIKRSKSVMGENFNFRHNYRYDTYISRLNSLKLEDSCSGTYTKRLNAWLCSATKNRKSKGWLGTICDGQYFIIKIWPCTIYFFSGWKWTAEEHALFGKYWVWSGYYGSFLGLQIAHNHHSSWS